MNVFIHTINHIVLYFTAEIKNSQTPLIDSQQSMTRVTLFFGSVKKSILRIFHSLSAGTDRLTDRSDTSSSGQVRTENIRKVICVSQI
ncbi:MAG TPA: hypothetical protein DD850_14265 [Erwinia persicina]|uniref:hypothetical protein n=1 Tax=Erwinia persicina TaxID=55211 RepID=UPI000E87F985|nr:hypothetical protein [Erwinia persicina]MCQ4103310.1 hypothetical protein [Erwinia persicina]UTX13486.1 hypothetical protein NOG67_02925 [Erwinia persicina]HBH63295.1 hypothetical protein [Erwinia persicina]HBQ80436.1 hypothetical protein [Erwinia persicina]HBT11894.1 hypothetical protein [Erwinia persicina]